MDLNDSTRIHSSLKEHYGRQQLPKLQRSLLITNLSTKGLGTGIIIEPQSLDLHLSGKENLNHSNNVKMMIPAGILKKITLLEM